MAKFHVALIAVFCLTAASDAFRLAGDEFNRLSIPGKNDGSGSRFPDSMFTASFIPVKTEPHSKPAVPYTRVTFRRMNTESDSESVISRAVSSLHPVNDESDSKSAVRLSTATFRPINRRFPQNSHPLPVRRDVEISYGNDMLIASNDNSDEIGKPVPLSHIRHNVENSPTIKMLFNRRYNYDRFLVKKRLETIKKLRNEFMEEKNQKSSGFMGSVRQFFGGFMGSQFVYSALRVLYLVIGIENLVLFAL